DHPNIATTLTNIANVLNDLDQVEEAIAAMVRVEAIERKALGTDHPYYRQTLNFMKALRQKADQ
ncbi:MAG: tetratricopeptide repeat protein, partial [Actinomycetota bacterium]